jgi:hypothetical protein
MRAEAPLGRIQRNVITSVLREDCHGSASSFGAMRFLALEVGASRYPIPLSWISMTVTEKDSNGPLAAFLRKWRRLKVNSYEPHEVLHEIPLRIYFGSGRPRRLILIAKEALVLRIAHELHRFPTHWVIVQRHGMPGPAHADELVTLSRRLGLPINFVGDLSPFYLHVFLELDRLLGSRGGHPHWAGISGRWIRLCKRLARPRRLGAIEREMSPIEHAHFVALSSRAPWLEKAVGAEAWRILASGQQISTEIASGVYPYGAGFHRKLVRLLDEEMSGK